MSTICMPCICNVYSNDPHAQYTHPNPTHLELHVLVSCNVQCGPPNMPIIPPHVGGLVSRPVTHAALVTHQLHHLTPLHLLLDLKRHLDCSTPHAATSDTHCTPCGSVGKDGTQGCGGAWSDGWHLLCAWCVWCTPPKHTTTTCACTMVLSCILLGAPLCILFTLAAHAPPRVVPVYRQFERISQKHRQSILWSVNIPYHNTYGSMT